MSLLPSSVKDHKMLMNKLDFAGKDETLLTITLKDLHLFSDTRMSGSTLNYEGCLILRALINIVPIKKGQQELHNANLISPVSWDHTTKLFRGEPTTNEAIPKWVDPSFPMAEFFNFCRAVDYYEHTAGQYPFDFCNRVPGERLGIFFPLLYHRLDIHPTKTTNETINVSYFVQYVNSIITHCYNVLSQERLPAMASVYVPHCKEFTIDGVVSSLVDGYMRIPLPKGKDVNAKSIVFIVEAKRSAMTEDQLQYQIITELSCLIYERRTDLIQSFRQGGKGGSKKRYQLLVQFSGNQAWFHLASFGLKHVQYLASVQNGRRLIRTYDPTATNRLEHGFISLTKFGPYDITSKRRDMIYFAELCVAVFLTACQNASNASDASLSLHRLATNYFGATPPSQNATHRPRSATV
ncbi:hypothetical protein F4680DRAFT_441204 [Xylaria scruposa]|nr:hypothetical protein F4680DRAFT_441204 [Xylaria scruposa]